MDTTRVAGYYARQAVRAGIVATYGFNDGSGWLIVAVAHWNSDRGSGAQDAHARRMKAAEALRNAIVASMNALGADIPVLILGDFNAEPYADLFHSALPTARSRAEVRRHRPRGADDVLFYSASWRWLGERYPWDAARPPPSLAGTYHWRGNRGPAPWRTFDQVFISPSLLESTSWTLDEATLGIFHEESVFDGSLSRPRAPFDHLPIVGHLKRPS